MKKKQLNSININQRKIINNNLSSQTSKSSTIKKIQIIKRTNTFLIMTKMMIIIILKIF
jgi:hypothetical protein